MLRDRFKVRNAALFWLSNLGPGESVCRFLVALWLAAVFTPGFAVADELILDESLTDVHAVGDFGVSSCTSSVFMDQSGLLNEAGEITTGQLYAFFKKQGIKSLDEITLSLDVDPHALRADYELDSIELMIEEIKYSLGPNSLKLPAYEMSSSKPEGQISVKLGYDFMKKFNESSPEKLKFNFAMSDGSDSSILKIAVMQPHANGFSYSRILLLVGFAVFWVIVFMVLFRATASKEGSPKSQQGASPA